MSMISRPVITEIVIASVEADDDGNVALISGYPAKAMTPAEAREVANALLSAALEAEQYRHEQEAAR